MISIRILKIHIWNYAIEVTERGYWGYYDLEIEVAPISTVCQITCCFYTLHLAIVKVDCNIPVASSNLNFEVMTSDWFWGHYLTNQKKPYNFLFGLKQKLAVSIHLIISLLGISAASCDLTFEFMASKMTTFLLWGHYLTILRWMANLDTFF